MTDGSPNPAPAPAPSEATPKHLEFQGLVSRVLTQFVSLESGQIDPAIRESLRLFVESLGLDRSGLWQFTGDDRHLVCTHTWARSWAPEILPPIVANEWFPWIVSRIRAGEAVWNATLEDVPDPIDRDHLKLLGIRSNAVLPLERSGRLLGALSFGTLRVERSWTQALREQLGVVATVFAQILARKQSDERFRAALGELARLKDQLSLENARLRREVGTMKSFRTIVTESRAIRAAMAQIETVAPTDATVLLLGETGVGKEVFAQEIHNRSRRRHRRLVHVNCAAIPTALMESELFGRERGAFTGAISRQIGRFELAAGSTVFLDEIGELSLDSQVKLLRILQDKVLERLGGSRAIDVDVRILAATNRDLENAVARGDFREDLYYRLNVFPITVPPLRDRVEDIPVLAWTFAEDYSRTLGKKILSISKQSMVGIKEYPWPGNIRELRNAVERAVISSAGPELHIVLPRNGGGKRGPVRLAEVEVEHIRGVLERVSWRIRGRGGAAELLGLKPTTLESRMAKLGIRRPPDA